MIPSAKWLEISNDLIKIPREKRYVRSDEPIMGAKCVVKGDMTGTLKWTRENSRYELVVDLPSWGGQYSYSVLGRKEKHRILYKEGTFEIEPDCKAYIADWPRDSVLAVAVSIDDMISLDQDTPVGYGGQGYGWGPDSIDWAQLRAFHDAYPEVKISRGIIPVSWMPAYYDYDVPGTLDDPRTFNEGNTALKYAPDPYKEWVRYHQTASWLSLEAHGLHHHWKFSKGSAHEWDQANPDANNYTYCLDAVERIRSEFAEVGLDNSEILVFNPPGYDETPALRQAVLDAGFILMLEARPTIYCKDLVVTARNTHPFESPDTPGLIKAIRLVNIGGDYCPPPEIYRVIDQVADHRGLFIMIAHSEHHGHSAKNENYEYLHDIFDYIRRNYSAQGKPVWYAFTSEIGKYYTNRKNTRLRYKHDSVNCVLKAKLVPWPGLRNNSREFYDDVGLTIYFKKPRLLTGIKQARVSHGKGDWKDLTNTVLLRGNKIIVPRLMHGANVEIWYDRG